MGLYMVERDLRSLPYEQLRVALQRVSAACTRLKLQGKKVRYISSVVFPTEGRGLCLFGAEDPAWVKEANDAAGLPCSRTLPVLDLTPHLLRREIWGQRTPSRHTGPGPVGHPGQTSEGSIEFEAVQGITRWLDDGQRLVERWVRDFEQLQGAATRLERENELLHQGISELRHELARLQAWGAEVAVAVQALESHVVKATDQFRPTQCRSPSET